MEQNKKFKLVSSKRTRYLLPNILTLGGVCLGISSIKFSIDRNFNLAVTLIFIHIKKNLANLKLCLIIFFLKFIKKVINS